MSSEQLFYHDTESMGAQDAKHIEFIDLCDMDDSLSDVEIEPIGIDFNASEFGLMSIHNRDTFYQHLDISAAVNDNISDHVNDSNEDNGSPVAGPSRKPRRNPRRANSIPIDYRCSSSIDGIPESPSKEEGDDVPEKGEDVFASGQVKRRKFLQAKRSNVTGTGCPAKSKKSTRKQRLSPDPQAVGAVYSPPSPVSSLTRRTWPVEGMHTRPVWPDARHTLPEPRPSRQERNANIMHRVLHAVLDYGRMRRDRVTQFCLLDEKIKYIEQQLFMLTHDEAASHASTAKELYAVDNDDALIPLMCAKIRYVIILMQKWSLEGDVARIMRYVKRETTEGSTAPTAHAKKGEVAILDESKKYVVLEAADEDTLLEALLCITSDLYCLTNDVEPDMLADYLDALSKGQQ